MKRRTRTFYIFETQTEDGNTVVRVGSDDSPLWGKSFSNRSEAEEAVRRRNAGALDFRSFVNGITAIYHAD